MTHDKNITRPDWIIHTVFGEIDEPIVSHTHGLNLHGHLELELNLPLVQKQAMMILNIIGLEIANGKSFKDNDINNDLFTCDIVFKETKPIYGDAEKILRVILPDDNLKFPWEDECKEPYNLQI